jgi:hypothetical protein
LAGDLGRVRVPRASQSSFNEKKSTVQKRRWNRQFFTAAQNSSAFAAVDSDWRCSARADVLGSTTACVGARAYTLR